MIQNQLNKSSPINLLVSMLNIEILNIKQISPNPLTKINQFLKTHLMVINFHTIQVESFQIILKLFSLLYSIRTISIRQKSSCERKIIILQRKNVNGCQIPVGEVHNCNLKFNLRKLNGLEFKVKHLLSMIRL